MTYNEIIAPYLIDFEKLEEGQQIWSVLDGEVKITQLDNDENDAICVTGKYWYSKEGLGYYTDKYPTLFTANPFENLQRVEPVDSTVRENRTLQIDPTHPQRTT